jgi:streptogramin lyase
MRRLLRRAALLIAPLGVLLLTACMQTYDLRAGVGHPWGIAFDGGGNLWFAEVGCDPTPICPTGQQPGQIGLIRAGGVSAEFFALPNIPGNQPRFVAIDQAGYIWFTTPGNDSIGRFDPSTATFQQWHVTPGSGPWHLAFAPDGKLWYTQHFSSAIGRFDPVTQTFTNFQTPTPASHPYGLAIQGSKVWFTENTAGVGRIGVLDTANGNRISEYIIRAAPSPDLTPHMIAIDADGNVWWTEGFERELGKLEPSQATSGTCGRSSGTCRGVTEYDLPPSPCGLTHGSAIVSKPSKREIWFTDSLSGEVGVMNTTTAQVKMHRLRGCDAHAHDGLALDANGWVWFAQQFLNQIVKFVQPP